MVPKEVVLQKKKVSQEKKLKTEAITLKRSKLETALHYAEMWLEYPHLPNELHDALFLLTILPFHVFPKEWRVQPLPPKKQTVSTETTVSSSPVTLSLPMPSLTPVGLVSLKLQHPTEEVILLGTGDSKERTEDQTVSAASAAASTASSVASSPRNFVASPLATGTLQSRLSALETEQASKRKMAARLKELQMEFLLMQSNAQHVTVMASRYESELYRIKKALLREKNVSETEKGLKEKAQKDAKEARENAARLEAESLVALQEFSKQTTTFQQLITLQKSQYEQLFNDFKAEQQKHIQSIATWQALYNAKPNNRYSVK